MKKYLTLGNLLACGAAVLGLVSLFMLLAPALGINDSETTFTGAQVAFGYVETSKGLLGNIETQVFNFSFMCFLPYLLALAGVVLAVLSVFVNCKYIAPVAGVLFLVAGIFFFLALPFCSVGDGFTKFFNLLGGDVKEMLSLGAGAIVAGVLSLLSALLCLAKTVLKK